MTTENPWPPLNEYGPAEVKRPWLKVSITAVLAMLSKLRGKKKCAVQYAESESMRAEAPARGAGGAMSDDQGMPRAGVRKPLLDWDDLNELLSLEAQKDNPYHPQFTMTRERTTDGEAEMETYPAGI